MGNQQLRMVDQDIEIKAARFKQYMRNYLQDHYIPEGPNLDHNEFVYAMTAEYEQQLWMLYDDVAEDAADYFLSDTEMS